MLCAHLFIPALSCFERFPVTPLPPGATQPTVFSTTSYIQAYITREKGDNMSFSITTSPSNHLSRVLFLFARIFSMINCHTQLAKIGFRRTSDLTADALVLFARIISMINCHTQLAKIGFRRTSDLTADALVLLIVCFNTSVRCNVNVSSPLATWPGSDRLRHLRFGAGRLPLRSWGKRKRCDGRRGVHVDRDGGGNWH